jgi:hypothetical protein
MAVTMQWVGVLWGLWRARNAKVFKNTFMPVDEIFDWVKYNVWNWLCLKKGKLRPDYASWCLCPTGWIGGF